MAEIKEYLVTWEMDIAATSPREAAELALGIHRDGQSIATVFTVVDRETDELVTMDLDEEHHEQSA